MPSQQNSEHLSFRARVPVFDANIGVGHCHDRPSPFADVTELQAEMQRHGVERGLIYHLQGETISAIEGNEALRAWQGDGLVPQWVAGPGADSLAQLRALHAAAEVSSVRLHNTEASRVPFADWIYGELLAWLAAERIPSVDFAGRHAGRRSHGDFAPLPGFTGSAPRRTLRAYPRLAPPAQGIAPRDNGAKPL